MGLEYQILLTKNKDGIYKGGETISGVVRCIINKPRKIEFINISLKGKGKCVWTEPYIQNKSSHFTLHHGNEKYVALHQKLLPKAENAMLAGIHELPFQFLLPRYLPSSFKDKLCKINYKIIAVISKSGCFFCTKKVKTEIQVRGMLHPCHSQHLIFGLTKSPFTLRKTVDLKIEIEKSVYAPGDHIKAKCLISNNTSIPVVCLQIKLITQKTYMSNDKHKYVQRFVIEKSVGVSPEIQGNCLTELFCAVATLPDLYTIQHSKIFRRDYLLIITLKFPFPHRDAFLEIPVIIGEKSLVEYGNMYQNFS